MASANDPNVNQFTILLNRINAGIARIETRLNELKAQREAVLAMLADRATAVKR